MKKQGGFISWLILIIVGLALLKYFFNWSIFDAASSEKGQATISYLRDILNLTWKYIGTPVMWLWDRVVELLPARS
ncbi:MAG: hypothetical protein AAB719_00465 [Patescibacteria group bacterium]